MRPTASKNQKLISQYPFLTEIMSLSLRDQPFETCYDIDDLTIKYQKADGDLMYRYAQNIGHFNTACVVTNRKNVVARRHEYLFAIDASDTIIRELEWPKSFYDLPRKSDMVYAWQVFWRQRRDKSFTDPIHDKVKYLVWVTVLSWYTQTRDPDSPFGDFKSRDMQITIHGAPNRGFKQLDEASCIEQNLYLTDNLRDHVLCEDPAMHKINGHLAELCRWFQDDVFDTGLKDALDKLKGGGISAHIGSITLLAAKQSGYYRVFLEDGRSHVTYQCRPDQDEMYTLSVGGTLPSIRNLTKSVIRAWQDPQKRTLFISDREVGVI